jgi:hypothetical protein
MHPTTPTNLNHSNPTHVSPITSSSPKGLQAEHQQAMMHLQQGHMSEQPSAHSAGPMHITRGQAAAGVVAGAAIAGLAAHHMAQQQNPGQMPNGEHIAVGENGMRRGEPSNGVAGPQGEKHVVQSSSVIIPDGRPGERGANGAPGIGAGERSANGAPGTGAGERGVNGAHGIVGERGANGAPGIMPGTRGANGTKGIGNVPLAPAFANPRHVSQQRSAQPSIVSRTPGARLGYAPTVKLFPHQGGRNGGVPGIYDPGGYVRTPQRAGTLINQSYAQQQLAMLPNYQSAMATNGRHMLTNRGAWPWSLPQQSTWWNPFSWNNGWNNQANNALLQNQYAANQYGYNPYGDNSPYAYDPYSGLNPYAGFPYEGDQPNAYWNDWNNYSDWNNWNNTYANAEPFYGDDGNSGPLGMLGNLFGGGHADNNSWMNNLLYFNAYSMAGNDYPVNYFAMNGYAPTPYVFIVDSGQFWQPGTGYLDTLPANYNAPITVAVQEVVPSFAANGNIAGYQPQQFYYDAFWDTNAQSYGYYDYRNKFHWLTFPGLSTYSNQYAAQ